MRRLHEFFEDIDHNKDGYITYEEWRYVYMPFFVRTLIVARLRTPVVRDPVLSRLLALRVSDVRVGLPPRPTRDEQRDDQKRGKGVCMMGNIVDFSGLTKHAL